MEGLIKALSARRIQAVAVDSIVEARSWILDRVPVQSTVGFGNSQTVKALGLARLLCERGNTVYDKTTAGSPEEGLRRLDAAPLVRIRIEHRNKLSLPSKFLSP